MTTHRQRYLLLGALAAALIMTTLFGTRALHSARHFRGGNVDDIRPWMPIPFIARSHDVPPHILTEALGMKLDDPDARVPIEVIAKQQNRPVSDVITVLQTTIKEFHAHPPAPPAPPPPPPPIATPTMEQPQS